MTAKASPPSPKARLLVIVSGLVLAWFALAEVGSQAWYLLHESKLPKNPVPASGEEILKRIHDFADENSSQISEREIGSSAMEMLKCSYGKTLAWMDFGGALSALTVLKWDERSVVGGVESMHNPGVCLRAAGWNVGTRAFLGIQEYCGVTSEVTRWDVSQADTKMQAYSVVFRRYSEQQVEENTPAIWNNTRLKSVISGRRDAPVMILLAYLSASPDEKQADARFEQIMKAVFCKQKK